MFLENISRFKGKCQCSFCPIYSNCQCIFTLHPTVDCQEGRQTRCIFWPRAAVHHFYGTWLCSHLSALFEQSQVNIELTCNRNDTQLVSTIEQVGHQKIRVQNAPYGWKVKVLMVKRRYFFDSRELLENITSLLSVKTYRSSYMDSTCGTYKHLLKRMLSNIFPVPSQRSEWLDVKGCFQ